MAEDDDRQAGMLAGDQVVDGVDVGDHLGAAVGTAEDAQRRIRRGRRAMAAMVMRVDMEADRRHDLGEAGVARGVLGQPVIDLDDAARPCPWRMLTYSLSVAPVGEAWLVSISKGIEILSSPTVVPRRNERQGQWFDAVHAAGS